MDYKKEIAVLLKYHRHSSGLTQQQLSDKSGVAITVIKEAETAKKRLALETYFKLSEALEICPTLYIIPLWILYTKEAKTALEALEQMQD